MKNEGRCKVITVFGVAVALGPNPAKGGGLGRHEEFNGAAEDGEGLRCTWGSGELSTKEAGTMGWGLVIGMAIWVWVPDPTVPGTGMIFYPWVAPVPDPNRDRYEAGIFFHPWVTRWVPNTLLPL
jgi:hypothetical protein